MSFIFLKNRHKLIFFLCIFFMLMFSLVLIIGISYNLYLKNEKNQQIEKQPPNEKEQPKEKNDNLDLEIVKKEIKDYLITKQVLLKNKNNCVIVEICYLKEDDNKWYVDENNLFLKKINYLNYLIEEQGEKYSIYTINEYKKTKLYN